MCELLPLIFISVLMINATFDDRAEESEGTELALLGDFLTSTVEVQIDVTLLLSLGFNSHLMKPQNKSINQ